MNNEMYLIHGEDYLKHINDKVFLYSMVRQLRHMISKLAPNRGNKALSELAECYNAVAEKMFRTWGIPVSYLVSGKESDLAGLMENELIAPEDAGYVPCEEVCDDECCCDCCGCEDCPYADCEDNEDEAEDETDDGDEFIEMLAAMSSTIHKIFGDKVSVHIIVED